MDDIVLGRIPAIRPVFQLQVVTLDELVISADVSELWTVLLLDSSHLIKLSVSSGHTRLEKILETATIVLLLLLYLLNRILVWSDTSLMLVMKASCSGGLSEASCLLIFLFLLSLRLLQYELCIILLNAFELISETRDDQD